MIEIFREGQRERFLDIYRPISPRNGYMLIGPFLHIKIYIEKRAIHKNEINK